MKCGAARKYLYGAGALSPTAAELAEAKRHVSHCRACQAFFASEVRLSKLLKRRVGVEKAPASLRERLLTKIAAQRSRTAARRPWTQPAHQAWPAVAIAAAILIVGLAAALILQHNVAKITPRELASILIADHLGNLPDEMQIISSDRETVQGWFRGRVDFTFRLPLTPDPPLIGGRLCRLQGQRAALIAYQHSQSRVSLFIFDGRDIELPEDHLMSLDGKRCLLDAEKGYNVVLWTERGLLYGLVSDASSVELLKLAAKFE